MADRPRSSAEAAPLAKVFREAAPPAVAQEMAERPELEATLRGMLEAGQRAWPKLHVEPAAFIRHLAERLPREGSAEEALSGIQAEHLYLACACALGMPAALAEFDRVFLPYAAKAVARMKELGIAEEEVQQALRQKLFIGPSGTGKIADYSGRGALGAWVRAAAVRTALNLRRSQKEKIQDGAGDAAELELPSSDPELAFFKRHYREQFQAAFREAMRGLSDRDIAVLRLNMVDGLNIDRIGVMYRTHRSTVARWIARAREQLLHETRRILTERLALPAAELDSVMRLVHSQLDVSINGFLREREDD